MTPYETASLAVADIALYIAGAAAFAAFVSAMTSPLVVWLMRKGIKEMVKANTDRAAQAAEDRKAIQAHMAQAAAQAAEDRKAIQAQMAQAAEDRKAIQAQMAQAAEDRKVTQGMLAALTELVRRTSPPSSQAGSQPGPAE